MNWFRHDTDATQDAKIKKLLIKHGAVGYAIYFHCLELISAEISETNLTFELEHDSEIIADNLHIKGTADKSGIDIVQDIMRTIVHLKLFNQAGERIFCFKLLKRLDSSMTSNTRFRTMITSAKAQYNNGIFPESCYSHDTVMIPSCQSHDTVMQEQNRIDENRIEKKKEEEKDWTDYSSFPPESQEVSKPEYNAMPRGNGEAMTRIETIRAHWNGQPELPKYRFMAISMRQDDLSGALRTLGAYSDDEIKKAIENYNTISTDGEYTPFPVYSTFAGFLKTGPENYGDDANPLDRCRKKHAGEKEMTVEEYKAKFYPEEVEQENEEGEE